MHMVIFTIHLKSGLDDYDHLIRQFFLLSPLSENYADYTYLRTDQQHLVVSSFLEFVI